MLKTYLTKAVLTVVPEQHDQFYRPMEGYLGSNEIERVIGSTNGGLNITPGSLIGIAGNILNPATVPVAPVEIVNTFRIKRYSFCFEFTTVGGHQGTIIEIVRGYTDLPEEAITIDGRFIDPNIRFWVNDYLTFIKNNTLAFRRNDGIMNPLIHNTEGVSLTPDATVSYASFDKYRTSGEYTGGVIDPNTILYGRPQLFQAQDNSSANYLSRVLEGYKLAANPYIGGARLESQNGLRFEDEDQSIDMFQTTINMVKAQTLSVNHWANLLLKDSFGTASFSYRTMMQHFSDFGFDKWTVVKKRPGTYIRSPLSETDGWNSASVECHLVYCLTHLLPDIMSKCSLQKVNLYCTNENIGNIRTTIPSAPVVLFESIAQDANLMMRYMNDLVNLVNIIALQGLVETRCGTYSIHMELDLLETSFFNISINGNMPEPFCAPMYCSSASSPMIGLSHDNLKDITATIYTLAEHVTDAFQAYSVKPNSITTMGNNFQQQQAKNTLNSFMSSDNNIVKDFSGLRL